MRRADSFQRKRLGIVFFILERFHQQASNNAFKSAVVSAQRLHMPDEIMSETKENLTLRNSESKKIILFILFQFMRTESISIC